MRKTIIAFLLSWAVLGGSARAQLHVTNMSEGLTPETLVNRLLGGGVTVFNVQYTGTNTASGIVCSGEDIIGIRNSILLTSGNTTNVLGPNTSNGAGADNNLDGDADLDTLIPGYQSFDAAVLEFDFVPQGDTVQFSYVFASEEYNDYVNSPFNDVFGFFVNGVNYALLPGTAIPVAINNVNNGYSSGISTGPCTHCEFFIDNVGTNNTRDTQMDGLTTVLAFTAPVLAGQTNHIKLAVADAGDHVLDSAVFIQAGSFTSGLGGATNCVTRNARYWFTHPYGTGPTCATLEAAMERAFSELGCGSIDLGFLQLPVGYRNDDNVRDEQDAVLEALGFYHRSSTRTGELGGTQSEKLRASVLCKDRKLLAIEYIAALANNLLLKTDPAVCRYVTQGVSTNFPSDLLTQARTTLAGEDDSAIKTMTTLLRKFNNSGLTNNLPLGLTECTPTDNKTLRTISRDPTSRFSCPGINDNCSGATTVVFPNPVSIFSQARFRGSIATTKLPSGQGFWKITPVVGVTNRTFTADTSGSNFATELTIFKGQCTTVVSNGIDVVDQSGLTTVTTTNSASSTQRAKVSFITDGSSTFFIRVAGGVGKIKLSVTSP